MSSQSSLYPGAIDDLPTSTALGALVIQAKTGEERKLTQSTGVVKLASAFCAMPKKPGKVPFFALARMYMEGRNS